jgi:hypothetical protein
MSQIIRKSGKIKKKDKDGKDVLYDLVYWNAVQKCNPESCGCQELCSGQDIGKPCKVLSSYMGGVFDVMINAFPGEFSEDIVYRIGMHLVPLYKILCRLKMQEFSEQEVFVSSRLGRNINPIFEEIRKTIMAIEGVWKNLGYIVGNGQVRKNRFIGHFNERNYYEVIEAGGVPMLDQMHVNN